MPKALTSFWKYAADGLLRGKTLTRHHGWVTGIQARLWGGIYSILLILNIMLLFCGVMVLLKIPSSAYIEVLTKPVLPINHSYGRNVIDIQVGTLLGGICILISLFIYYLFKPWIIKARLKSETKRNTPRDKNIELKSNLTKLYNWWAIVFFVIAIALIISVPMGIFLTIVLSFIYLSPIFSLSLHEKLLFEIKPKNST